MDTPLVAIVIDEDLSLGAEPGKAPFAPLPAPRPVTEDDTSLATAGFDEEELCAPGMAPTVAPLAMELLEIEVPEVDRLLLELLELLALLDCSKVLEDDDFVEDVVNDSVDDDVNDVVEISDVVNIELGDVVVDRAEELPDKSVSVILVIKVEEELELVGSDDEVSLVVEENEAVAFEDDVEVDIDIVEFSHCLLANLSCASTADSMPINAINEGRI